MRRRTKTLIAGVVLLTLLALLTLWALAASSATPFVIALLSSVLPGTLTVESTEGPIRGPLVLHDVVWETARMEVHIDRAELRWRLRRLLRRQLDITSLHARGVRVMRSPSEERKPLQDINLRVNIILRDVLIEEMTIGAPGSDAEQHLRIERVALATVAEGDRVTIERLDFLSEDLDLDLTGTLNPVGAYDVDLRVAWAWRGRDMPEMVGEGTLRGTLERLQVDQRLTAPAPARVSGLLFDPFYDLRLDLAATFRDLDPRLFDERVPVELAAGRATIAGTLETWTSRGEVTLRTEEHGTFDADYQLAHDENLWRFERLRLTRPDGPLAVAVRGDVRTGEETRLDLALSWRSLVWPLVGAPRLRSDQGEGAVTGTLDAYDFQLQGHLASADIPDGRWRLRGSGDRDRATARELSGHILGGTVAGSATARWRPSLAWTATVVVRDVAIEDLAPAVPPELGDGTWRLVATGTSSAMTLRSIRAQVLAGSLTGSARVAWSPEIDWSADLVGTDLELFRIAPALPPEVGEGRWEVTARGGREAMTITALDARTLGGRLIGSGEVRWEPELAYDVDLVARDVDLQRIAPALPAAFGEGTWELSAQGDREAMTFSGLDARTLGGRIAGSGEVRWEPALSYDVALEAVGVAPEQIVPALPAGLGIGSRWEITARGDREGMIVEPIVGQLLGGRVAARGRIGWEPVVTWDLSLQAEGVDPSVAWPEWPGRLDLVAASAGRMTDAGPRGEVTVERAEGTLRGFDLVASGAVELGGDTHLLRGVQAVWGGGRIEATGAVGERSDLAFTVADADLGALLPWDVAGVATATGRLTGPVATPRIQADLTVASPRYGDRFAADRLTGVVDLDLAPGGRFAGELTALDAVAFDRQAERLDLRLDGVRETHTLAGTWSSPEGELVLAATGGLVDGGWRGRLERLDFASDTTGSWRLSTPTEIALGRERTEIGELCWVSEGARVCAQGGWTEEGQLTIVADLGEVPLALLAPLLPPGLELDGEIDGNVQLGTSRDGIVLGEADLRVASPIRIGSTSPERDVPLVLVDGNLLARFSRDGIEMVLAVTTEPTGEVTGTAELPPYRWGAPIGGLAMDGALAARFTDLSFLPSLVSSLGAASGSLSADLRLGGTLGALTTSGRAALDGGTATVPALGLELTAIELDALGDQEQTLTVAGTARSGEGTLAVTGTVPLPPSAERPIRLRLDGNDVEVMDVQEARIVASPRLDVTHTGELLSVRGEVLIPEALISYTGPEEGPVRVSPDVVYLNSEPETEAAPGLEIDARVQVVLGNDVRFDGMGLETRLAGSLLLIDQPDLPTRARGDLQLVEGTYEAYGQELVIERGRLAFAGGPVTNPALSIRASREAEDGVVAGVELRGTLQAPELTVWSQPTMSESDAVSYLLFGRPLGVATGGDQELVDRAAAALGVRGANLLAARLGASLGLAEASIETRGSIEEAQLVLGKYLSPRLFIGYGVGLFERGSTFRIRYLIDDSWTLQAEVGDGTSADVLYVVERGGRDLPKQGEGLRVPDNLEEVGPVPVPTEDEGEGAFPEDEEDEDDEEPPSPPPGSSGD